MEFSTNSTKKLIFFMSNEPFVPKQSILLIVWASSFGHICWHTHTHTHPKWWQNDKITFFEWSTIVQKMHYFDSFFPILIDIDLSIQIILITSHRYLIYLKTDTYFLIKLIFTVTHCYIVDWAKSKNGVLFYYSYIETIITYSYLSETKYLIHYLPYINLI